MNYFFGSTPVIPKPEHYKEYNTETDSNSDSDEQKKSSIKKLSFNKIRGKTINKSSTGNFCTKEISIENLIECYNKKKIIIPDFQRLVDQEKINSMIKTYKKNPEYFNFLTNPIQLVKLIDNDTSNLYLIDGQHRFFMYQQLNIKSIDGYIYINIINCSTVNEMLEIYQNFNYDNQNINFDKDEILEFQLNSKYIVMRDQLQKSYKKFFKNTDNDIFSIEEFVKNLKLHEYLEYFDSVKDALLFMFERNDIFYTQYYTKRDIEVFNKKEKELILNGKIFSLKKNNFIEFLMNDDSDIPVFEYKHVIIKKRTKNTV